MAEMAGRVELSRRRAVTVASGELQERDFPDVLWMVSTHLKRGSESGKAEILSPEDGLEHELLLQTLPRDQGVAPTGTSFKGSGWISV